MVAIILHNLIIDVEGSQSAEHFRNVHGPDEEEEDAGIHRENGRIDNNDAKRRQLVEELWALRN